MKTTDLLREIVLLSTGTIATLSKDLGPAVHKFKDLDALQYHFRDWTADTLTTVAGQVGFATWQDAWRAYVVDMNKR